MGKGYLTPEEYDAINFLMQEDVDWARRVYDTMARKPLHEQLTRPDVMGSLFAMPVALNMMDEGMRTLNSMPWTPGGQMPTISAPAKDMFLMFMDADLTYWRNIGFSPAMANNFEQAMIVFREDVPIIGGT